jgi:hypothetical protein
MGAFGHHYRPSRQASHFRHKIVCEGVSRGRAAFPPCPLRTCNGHEERGGASRCAARGGGVFKPYAARAALDFPKAAGASVNDR